MRVKNPQPAKLPAQRDIEIRAYEIYSERGAEDGHALEHWFIAEKELLHRTVHSTEALNQEPNSKEKQLAKLPAAEKRWKGGRNNPVNRASQKDHISTETGLDELRDIG